MRKRVYLFLIFFITLALSCLSTVKVEIGDAFKEIRVPKGKALIYLYRPSMWAGTLHYDIKVNGKKLIALKGNTYYPYVVNPGKYTFTAKTEVEKSVSINAQAGKKYYLLASVTPGFWVGHPYLEFVTLNENKYNDLKKCRIVRIKN
ncbi:MAG: DUF2846 domain-containing protein [Spirochaetes bacterium]|nr:DUF2846 domain-containing protein [Spirochaetota bacterium]